MINSIKSLFRDTNLLSWQNYTPTWTQSATITKTTNWARYYQLNKLVTVSVKMTATSSGTANNAIKIGLPVNASSNNYLMGTAFWSGTTNVIPLHAIYDTASTVVFYFTPTDIIGDFFGLTASAAGGITIASGASMYMNLSYEAA